MPGNEFEKQMRQRMAELQLRPSGEVWQEVERRIRRERKRRIFLIWFSLAFLLLTGAGILYFYSSTKQLQQKIEKIAGPVSPMNPPPGTAKENTPFAANDHKDSTGERNQQKGSSKNIQFTSANKGVLQNHSVSNTSTTREKYLTNSITASSTTKELTTQPSREVQTVITATGDSVSTLSITQAVGSSTTLAAGATEVSHTDSTVQSIVAAPKQDSSQTAASPSNPKKNQKHHWDISAYATAGQSGLADNLAGVFSWDESPLLIAPSGAPNALIAATGRPQVPTPKKRFSWQLGIAAKRQVSARISLSAGLQLSGMNLLQKTGLRSSGPAIAVSTIGRDSTRRYYWNGTTADHVNRYTLLQTPLAMHWELIPGKKTSLFWQNGFTPGIIMHSNAIVYDQATNIFYKDRKSVNTFQVSYTTALYLRFAGNSKHPWTVGAALDYHLTELLKKTELPVNHFFNIGVRAGWTIFR